MGRSPIPAFKESIMTKEKILAAMRRAQMTAEEFYSTQREDISMPLDSWRYQQIKDYLPILEKTVEALDAADIHL